jgi:hypothetical protein
LPTSAAFQILCGLLQFSRVLTMVALIAFQMAAGGIALFKPIDMTLVYTWLNLGVRLYLDDSGPRRE